MGFVRFSLQTGIMSFNSINQFIIAMVKCGVLFEVRIAFLNIQTSLGLSGLIHAC
jgi:hypothetical protein